MITELNPPFDLREIVAATASGLLRSVDEYRTTVRPHLSRRQGIQFFLAHRALQIAIRLLRASLRSARILQSGFVPLTSPAPPWTEGQIRALEKLAGKRGKPVVWGLIEQRKKK